MHPDDALLAVNMGVDGIVISNHGGKALDRAPAPLEALPAIKAALGDRVPIMLDSGVRRGSDIVVARCLGADLVFVGRATLYGVVAGAAAGRAARHRHPPQRDRHHARAHRVSGLRSTRAAIPHGP